MPDNAVVIQLSAQDAEVIAAWQRVRQQGPQAMAAELDKAGKAGKKAGEETASAFDGLAGTVKDVATNLVGITSASGAVLAVAQLIRSEWDTIAQRMKERAGLQVSLSQAQAQARAALGPAADISADEMERYVNTNSKIPLSETYQVTESALKEANQSGFSQRRAMETAVAAANLTPAVSPLERNGLGAAAVELQQLHKDLTPPQSVAMVRNWGHFTESNGGQVNQSLTQAIGHIMENAPGTNANQAAAFILGIQRQANLSDTAEAGDLALKVTEALRKGGSEGDLDAKLRELQTSAALQDAVSSVTTRNRESFETVQQLSQPGSPTLQAIGELTGEFNQSPQAILDRELKREQGRASDASQTAAGLRRQTQTQKEKRAVVDPAGAAAVEAHELAMQMQVDAGESYLSQMIGSIGSKFDIANSEPLDAIKSAQIYGRDTIEQARNRGESNAVIAQLLESQAKIEASLRDLSKSFGKPLDVNITGDRRPDVPQRSDAARLSE